MDDNNGKWEYGLLAVLIGVGGLAGVFTLVAFRWHDQTGIAALGTIASPIVAIVSAYFGVQSAQKATKAITDAGVEVGKANKSKSDAIETLRTALLPKLTEAAQAQSMTDSAAQGYAATTWDAARSQITD